MKISRDPQLKTDLLKLACLAGAILGTMGVFIVTPSLSSPTLLSLVATALISPWVSSLERRGYSRVGAISLIFLAFALLIFMSGFWGAKITMSEWVNFKIQATEQFQLAIQKLRELELNAKTQYPFLKSLHPTDSFLRWGKETGRWFVDNGPSLMGSMITWIFIIPPLTFVLLNDGRAIRRGFFQLVPNRYFESFFMITTDITDAITDYIRAKLIEATLVGLMVTFGLAMISAPYSLVLGIVAGITNIVPYLGPILGAVPAIFIAGVGQEQSSIAVPVALVYLVANLVDTLVIFPLVVAKLVDLHPFILIGVVAVGQQYYGLVGMLISIPVASALKVVLQEIYNAVYESRLNHLSLNKSLEDPEKFNED